MSTTPINLQLNDDVTKAIRESLNPEELRSIVMQAAEKQLADNDAARLAQAAEEKAAADRLAAAEAAEVAAPKSFNRTEIIAGKEFNFIAPSELELERQIASAYRVAFGVQPSQTVETHQPDAAAIAAAAEAEAAAKAELELQFKRGDISAAEYLEKSGAVGDYLAKQGVSIDALKKTVDQTQSQSYEKSWADATTEFLANSDWPGGDRNREQLGLRIAALNLIAAEDKVAALHQAYAEMRRTNSVFENELLTKQPVTTAGDRAVADAAAAKTAADLRLVVATPATPATPAAPAAASSSSLWDRSSGVTDHVTVDKTKPAQFMVDPKATPQEIMDAWKKYNLDNNMNPDSEFKKAFSGQR